MEVPDRSSFGRKSDRGESSGGGSGWKLEDATEVEEEDRSLFPRPGRPGPGDKGDIGSGMSLGENIMTSLDG
jgi:hypothetical protein